MRCVSAVTELDSISSRHGEITAFCATSYGVFLLGTRTGLFLKWQVDFSCSFSGITDSLAELHLGDASVSAIEYCETHSRAYVLCGQRLLVVNVNALEIEKELASGISAFSVRSAAAHGETRKRLACALADQSDMYLLEYDPVGRVGSTVLNVALPSTRATTVIYCGDEDLLLLYTEQGFTFVSLTDGSSCAVQLSSSESYQPTNIHTAGAAAIRADGGFLLTLGRRVIFKIPEPQRKRGGFALEPVVKVARSVVLSEDVKSISFVYPFIVVFGTKKCSILKLPDYRIVEELMLPGVLFSSRTAVVLSPLANSVAVCCATARSVWIIEMTSLGTLLGELVAAQKQDEARETLLRRAGSGDISPALKNYYDVCEYSLNLTSALKCLYENDIAGTLRSLPSEAPAAELLLYFSCLIPTLHEQRTGKDILNNSWELLTFHNLQDPVEKTFWRKFLVAEHPPLPVANVTPSKSSRSQLRIEAWERRYIIDGTPCPNRPDCRAFSSPLFLARARRDDPLMHRPVSGSLGFIAGCNTSSFELQSEGGAWFVLLTLRAYLQLSEDIALEHICKWLCTRRARLLTRPPGECPASAVFEERLVEYALLKLYILEKDYHSIYRLCATARALIVADVWDMLSSPLISWRSAAGTAVPHVSSLMQQLGGSLWQPLLVLMEGQLGAGDIRLSDFFTSCCSLRLNHRLWKITHIEKTLLRDILKGIVKAAVFVDLLSASDVRVTYEFIEKCSVIQPHIDNCAEIFFAVSAGDCRCLADTLATVRASVCEDQSELACFLVDQDGNNVYHYLFNRFSFARRCRDFASGRNSNLPSIFLRPEITLTSLDILGQLIELLSCTACLSGKRKIMAPLLLLAVENRSGITPLDCLSREDFINVLTFIKTFIFLKNA